MPQYFEAGPARTVVFNPHVVVLLGTSPQHIFIGELLICAPMYVIFGDF